MSIRTIIRHYVVCDGCGAEHGKPVGAESPADARGLAFIDGWRQRNRISAATGRAVKFANDVCPECLPTWQNRIHQVGERV